MTEAVRCGRCGARYGAQRAKCPKCGGSVPRPIQAASAPRVGRGTAAVAGGVAAFAVLVGALWYWGLRQPNLIDTEPSGASPLGAALLRPSDRQAVVPPPGSASVPAVTPFRESAAEGRQAYAEGNLEEALARFRERIAQSPSDAESLSNAGQVLVRLGRPAEAQPLLAKAVALDPDRWAYRFNLARVFGLLGDWVRAAQEYQEAARVFPDDYATLFNLGQALHRAGQEEAAVAEYRRAVELNPGDATFHLALGISLEKLGRSADAVAAYRRFLEIDPSAREAPAVTARVSQLLTASPPAVPQTPPPPVPQTPPPPR